MKPLWGFLGLSQWDSCAQIKYPLAHFPIQKSTIESTSPMPEIVCVWQTCHGLSRVLFTLYLSKNCVQALQDVQADAQANPPI